MARTRYEACILQLQTQFHSLNTWKIDWCNLDCDYSFGFLLYHPAISYISGGLPWPRRTHTFFYRPNWLRLIIKTWTKRAQRQSLNSTLNSSRTKPSKRWSPLIRSSNQRRKWFRRILRPHRYAHQTSDLRPSPSSLWRHKPSRPSRRYLSQTFWPTASALEISWK